MPQFEDEDMYEIFDGFLIETAEILDQISQDLMLLESDSENISLVNQLFRSFHTIKGTSSFMGFTQISGFTHEAEDLLNKLRKEELKVNENIVELLLLSRDAIETMVDQIKNDEKVQTFDDLLSMIQKAKDDKSSEDTMDASTDKSLIDSVSQIEGEGDFSEDEEALLQAAFAELNSEFNASEDDTSEEKEGSAPEIENSENDISDVEDNSKAEDDSDKSSDNDSHQQSDEKKQSSQEQKTENKLPARKPTSATETIRIDIDRIESMMDLSGELVLSRNRLAQITNRLENNPNDPHILQELIENYTQLDKVTSDIQNSVMKMRMVQVGKLYQKAPRIVRDLSREFDKKIKLVVSGEDTEIDRTIIEELNDPLVHMIRNSCDHGIESKEKRLASGKSEEGHIYLDALQEGNHIILKIGDDGAGIDPKIIKNKCLEKGVITQSEADNMSDKDIIQLIFAPGFSTAQTVSAVSGRGVGMDVVRTNIKKLKGSIEIESTVGKGSTFIIKLPLTLAIIQGLLIGIQDEIYALPLTTVDEVVTVKVSEIEEVNSRPVVRIRNQIIPIFDLENIFQNQSKKNDQDYLNIVVVAHGNEKSGIVVSSLHGQQEIVIKTLGPLLQGTKGIAGSTILGDGRVIMILDMGDILEDYEETHLMESFV
jgi:two-component system chemotaxis sensor kinase CheA